MRVLLMQVSGSVRVIGNVRFDLFFFWIPASKVIQTPNVRAYFKTTF